LFTKYFSMAFEALFLNKVRSFLTTLGIIIGVFSVIVMISLGQASQAYITDQVKGLGAGVLIITPGNPKNSAFGGPGTSVKTLTIDDARVLENIPGTLFVSPNTFIMSLMTFGRNNAGATVIGTSPNYQQAGNLALAKGRFFTDQESRTGAKVIVLGSKLASDLFKNSIVEPLNAKVKVDKQRYRVIGILEEKGTSISGAVDDRAYMPTVTFQQTLKSGRDVVSILLKLKSDRMIPLAQEKVHNILRYRHGIRESEEDDFKIQTQAELLSTVNVITNVFTLLLAGIAAISLVVGGIGIMNIMLVSVTERTREIGVRKAVGAQRRDILIQFLIESATISLIGGILGMLLGLGVTKIVTQLANLPFIISPVAVIGAFAFSAGVGIFFGLYPANKASKLDPVDALRYE
jgi:putative ABC transport system permease protein